MSKLRRLATPWAIEKKKEKFVIAPKGAHPLNLSMPLLVLIRDVLKLVETAVDAREIITSGQVLVDGKVCKDVKRGLGLFDVLELPALKKAYRIILKRIPVLIEVPYSESKVKLCKIVGKKIVKNGKVQLNLHDGRNIILAKDGYSTNDSLLLELPEQKIKSHIPFEEDTLVFVTSKGKTAKIKKIERGINRRVFVEDEDGVTELPFRFVISVGKEKPVINIGE